MTVDEVRKTFLLYFISSLKIKKEGNYIRWMIGDIVVIVWDEYCLTIFSGCNICIENFIPCDEEFDWGIHDEMITKHIKKYLKNNDKG